MREVDMDIFENSSRTRYDDDELGWLDIVSSDDTNTNVSTDTTSLFDFPIKTGEYEGEGPGGTDVRNERTQDYTGGLTKILQTLKNSGLGKAFMDKQGNLDWLKLLTVLGSGYAGYKSKAEPSGGGVAYAYKGPESQLTRTVAPGMYGPVAQFAAKGGIMRAYAGGGPVAMEDGGFVMTKKAVDGAGGPRGIQSLLPGARPIRGPGTGTSDSIPAYIRGRNTVTPARVSNGEAYVPKRAVQQAGGSRQLYNLMNMLQRRA